MLQAVTARWRLLRQRPALALLLDVVLIVGVMYLVHSWQTRNLPDEQAAPALVLQMLQGGDEVEALGQGESGVVYFFAPWCAICKHSIGNLDQLVANGDINWASVVALDYSGTEEVSEFIRQTEVELPVFLGRNSTAAEWGVSAYPTYFVIDSQGQIDSRSVGYSTRLGLQARAAMAD